MTEQALILKFRYRQLLLKKRAGLTIQRRQEAREKLLALLEPTLEKFSEVLSFASLAEEIDLWPLNEKLAKGKRLLLPKVVGKDLVAYQVNDLEHDLQSYRWKFLEPIPDRCKEIPLEKIRCVLVPGLGFDVNHMRIGYGNGYYDRFLKSLSSEILKIGVGFKEQFFQEAFPIMESHDQKVDQLYLL